MFNAVSFCLDNAAYSIDKYGYAIIALASKLINLEEEKIVLGVFKDKYPLYNVSSDTFSFKGENRIRFIVTPIE